MHFPENHEQAQEAQEYLAIMLATAILDIRDIIYVHLLLTRLSSFYT